MNDLIDSVWSQPQEQREGEGKKSSSDSEAALPELQSTSGSESDNATGSPPLRREPGIKIPEVIMRKTGIRETHKFVCFALFAVFAYDQDRGPLSMENFTDIVCDRSLRPAPKLIAYLKGCKVPQSTIENVLRVTSQTEFEYVIQVRDSMIRTELTGAAAQLLLSTVAPLFPFTGVPDFQQLTGHIRP